jgi:hypothetical protein
MDNLQVLNDAASRPPDHGRGLDLPVVVPLAANAIARQIKRGAVLPVRSEHRTHAAPLARGVGLDDAQLKKLESRLNSLQI